MIAVKAVMSVLTHVTITFLSIAVIWGADRIERAKERAKYRRP
jgi:hypothetical protein